jgi:hypothetical protein
MSTRSEAKYRSPATNERRPSGSPSRLPAQIAHSTSQWQRAQTHQTTGDPARGSDLGTNDPQQQKTFDPTHTQQNGDNKEDQQISPQHTTTIHNTKSQSTMTTNTQTTDHNYTPYDNKKEHTTDIFSKQQMKSNKTS